MPHNSLIQSTQRTVKILYAVAGSEEGRTINQIAETLGLKPNTAYRLIKTLEQEHMLQRKTSPLRFALGSALSELSRLDEERHLLTVAGRILIRTQAQLPESNIALLELHGTDTFQRLCVESDRPGVLIKRRDFKVDFYSRASSLLFLAYSHPDVAERIYRAHSFESEGKPVWKSRAKLENFLHQIRQDGRALPDFPERNYYRLAVPIFSPGKEVIAAIGGYITMDVPARSKKTLVSLCHAAAQKVTDSL